MRKRDMISLSGAVVLAAAMAAANPAWPQSVTVQDPNGPPRVIDLAPRPAPPEAAAPATDPGTGLPTGRLGGSALGTNIAPADAPPPVTLSGDGLRQETDCGGRDVVIEGNDGHFVLRGGCRSVSVRGNGNAIQAELLPGTRIAIDGNADTVAFVLAGAGPDPIVSVNGERSHAWRVQRLGEAPNSGIEVGAAGIVVPGGHAQVTEMPSVPQLKKELGAVDTDKGTLVALSSDVLFNFDSDRIRPDAKDTLIKLSQLIAQTHPAGLKITGNTDSIGGDAYNMSLSLRRARAVQNWLNTEGEAKIANETVEGHGFHDPVAPNTKPDGSDDPDGRQKNRRVSVLLEG